MSSKGELQKQISIIWAKAKAQGYNCRDIIPEEMQEHFQQVAELNAARKYIKEVECREKDLQSEKDILLNRLKAKEDELANQPEESKALEVDLQQAQHQIEFQKTIANAATERAERYQHKLTEAIKRQTLATDTATKIERLETSLHAQQILYLNLVKENAQAAELSEKQRLSDQALLAEKTRQLSALQSHTQLVELESEQFSETYTSLIDTLESEHSSAAASANDKALLLLHTDKLHSAIVSEITPLNRFFTRALSVLGIYQFIFQTLSDPRNSSVASLPFDLHMLMEGAAEDLLVYQEVHSMLQAGNVAEEQVRAQIDGIAANAGRMYNCLDCIRDDIEGFLGRVRSEPAAWRALKARFGGGVVGRMKRFSMR